MVTVTGLNRLKTKHAMYGFSITLGGFIVNGFTYNPTNGSIRMPAWNFNGKNVPVVKAYGIHIKRLREQLDKLLNKSEDIRDGVDD